MLLFWLRFVFMVMARSDGLSLKRNESFHEEVLSLFFVSREGAGRTLGSSKVVKDRLCEAFVFLSGNLAFILLR